MIWLYHQDHEPELFENDQEEEMLKQGWVDTPDKFTQKGDTDHGERDFSDFTRSELKKYAQEVFGVSIDARKKKAVLIEQIEALYDSHKSY